ncbi:MAG: hypothetical protein P1U63_08495 [Coxiellaceae bacterium]|nr:hypothetical protein [Coxiellaceae bacterium]
MRTRERKDEAARVAAADGYVQLPGAPPSRQVSIEVPLIHPMGDETPVGLMQNQMQSTQAAARLHDNIYGDGWKTRLQKRWFAFWYAEKGCEFVLAEALKITISIVSYYGVVSYALWDNCGMPPTSEQAKCNFDYDKLRVYEFGALTALFVITGMLRQQRRKLELTPALRVHGHFTQRWKDLSEYVGSDLSKHVDELYNFHNSTPLADKLSRLEETLAHVSPQLGRLQQGVLSYSEIPLKKSCYTSLDKAMRIGVSGFLGFNLGMQFILMLSTLSKHDDFEWHGADLAKMSFAGWCTVLFSVAVVFNVIPDDLTVQTNDINHKAVRQYELIANSCLDKRNVISRQLKQCWKALCSIEVGGDQEHGAISSVDSTKIQDLKSRIGELNAQANKIVIPKTLLTANTGIVRVGAVRAAVCV